MNMFTYTNECPLCHQDRQITETPMESGQVVTERCRTCDYSDIYEVFDEIIVEIVDEVEKGEPDCV